MVTKTNPPSRSRPIVDSSGAMTQELTSWVQQANNAIAIKGTGNPEGVIEAQSGRWFVDQTVSVTPFIYFKQLDEISGDKTQGWRVVA